MSNPLLDVPSQEWQDVPRYFIALLGALQLRNTSFDLMRRLETSEWQDLLSFSDSARLTLLVAQLPSGVLPVWVASRLQQNISDNTERVAQIRDVYMELAKALQAAKADHLVVKGFTQFPQYTRSLNLRFQSDIDLFCPANTILTARDTLLKLGYEPSPYQENVPIDHLPTMCRSRGWKWRGNFFDPGMAPQVELHYCLWNEAVSHLAIPEVDQFWHRRERRDLQEFSYPALDPIDQIAFCSLHILRGSMRGDRIIHHVYELAYFLNAHSHDEALWSDWQTLHSDRLRSIEAISFCFAKTWFGCDVSPVVERHIRELPPAIERWFQLFCISSLKEMFVPARHGVWLNVALVESTRAKLSVIRRGLLPQRIPPLAIGDYLHLTTNGQVVSLRGPYRAVRYALYIFMRLGQYIQIFFRAIMCGTRWWLSQGKCATAR
jgi:Uncharacterised nucleotidyltransferase